MSDWWRRLGIFSRADVISVVGHGYVASPENSLSDSGKIRFNIYISIYVCVFMSLEAICVSFASRTRWEMIEIFGTCCWGKHSIWIQGRKWYRFKLLITCGTTIGDNSIAKMVFLSQSSVLVQFTNPTAFSPASAGHS